MQNYRCAACAGVLYFDDLRCGCVQQIAFGSARDALVPLDVPCANREVIGCNWTGPPNGGGLCHACGNAVARTVTVTVTVTGLVLAINHVNRFLEIPDLCPFVLSDTVREKLSFTHHWLRRPLRAAQGEPA